MGGSSHVCSGGGDSTSHSSVSSMRGETTSGVTPSSAISSTSAGSSSMTLKPGLRSRAHGTATARERAPASSERSDRAGHPA
eukprot:7134990-Prymnesium_polylepis.1